MKQKKEKKKWGVIIFMVILMLGTSFSVIFFGFSEQTQKSKYNGLSFELSNGVWTSKIDGKDAYQNVPVIYFKAANATQIITNGSCIIAQAATPADFIKTKDRILYGLLGVMQ